MKTNKVEELAKRLQIIYNKLRMEYAPRELGVSRQVVALGLLVEELEAKVKDLEAKLK
jgi:polyhydroxyalkanoate synthesis regulator phasin